MGQFERMTILLRAYMVDAQGWGHIQGQQVYACLLEQISLAPNQMIEQISLAGIERADVPFFRETLIALAIQHRGRRGFCIVEALDSDVLANLDGAAWRAQQPLFCWSQQQSLILLGPQPSVGLQKVLIYALSVPETSTREVSAVLSLNITSASNLLYHLWQQGYLLRKAQAAPSGGKEYRYYRIS